MSISADAFARRHPSIARLIERIVLWPYRFRIRRSERTRLAVLEQTIAAIRTRYVKCHQQGLTDLAGVFNAALYMLLFDRDFAALKEFFLAADNYWDRQFAGRQMAAMLYEGVRDLSFLIGKEFRNMIQALELSQQRRIDISRIRSQLADFHKTHAERLKELRNAMAAHRDRDVMAQLRVLDHLDPFEVYGISVAFYANVRNLTPVLTDIIEELGTPRIVLQQLARRHHNHLDV